MPNPAVVDAFIFDVLSNDHAGAIGRWYAEDAWTQENQGPITAGRERLVARELRAMSRMRSVETELVAPPIVDGQRVAIRWRFTFITNEGARLTLEEVAWQEWDGDQIAWEAFFYDPAQMRP